MLRGVLAISLMLAFYGLALAMAAGLLWVGIMAFTWIPRIHGRAGLVLALVIFSCFVVAGLILWSLVPRRDRFSPPGPELRAPDAPDLAAEIRLLADVTGQAPPEHVYLVAGTNAFVSERGGFMGIGSHRVMGIGLPLLQLLTLGELRAVLTHELGHFHGGDTKLGPWIYRTRDAIGRTLRNLPRAPDRPRDVIELVMHLVRAPFVRFGGLFLRTTRAISRAQEHSADALAARVVGSAPCARGFEKSCGGSVAFEHYFENEVAPLLAAGRHPPIAAGYRRFMAVPSNAARMSAIVEDLVANEQLDPYDSHPPTRERIAAVNALAVPPRLDDDRPAIDLLPDVRAAERALLASMIAEAANLVPIEWEDAVGEFYLPSWRRRAEKERDALVGLTPASLPRDVAELERRARAVAGSKSKVPKQVPADKLIEWATLSFGAALCAALADCGWAVRTGPGEPIELVSGERTLRPFEEVGALLGGATAPEVWEERVRGLGIDGIPLSGR